MLLSGWIRGAPGTLDCLPVLQRRILPPGGYQVLADVGADAAVGLGRVNDGVEEPSVAPARPFRAGYYPIASTGYRVGGDPGGMTVEALNYHGGADGNRSSLISLPGPSSRRRWLSTRFRSTSPAPSAGALVAALAFGINVASYIGEQTGQHRPHRTIAARGGPHRGGATMVLLSGLTAPLGWAWCSSGSRARRPSGPGVSPKPLPSNVYAEPTVTIS